MGHVCAFLSFLGIFSMSNSHSDVACILVPSGCVPFNPYIFYISTLNGLSIHKQCVVVPLQTIVSMAYADFSGVCIVVWINLLLSTILLQYSPPLHIFFGLLYVHPPYGLSHVASDLWTFLLFVHVPLLCAGSTQYPCNQQ